MKAWVLLVTENLAELVSLASLIYINIRLLFIEKDHFKYSIIWNCFIISLSFLIVYVFLDIALGRLLIGDIFFLIKDLALMISSVMFFLTIHELIGFCSDTWPVKKGGKK